MAPQTTLRSLSRRTKITVAAGAVAVLVAAAGGAWTLGRNGGTEKVLVQAEAPTTTTTRVATTTTPPTTTTSTTVATTTEVELPELSEAPIIYPDLGYPDLGGAPTVEPPPHEIEAPCPTGTVDATYAYEVLSTADTYDDGATYFVTYDEQVTFTITNRMNVDIVLFGYSIESTAGSYFSGGTAKQLAPGQSHTSKGQTLAYTETRPTGKLDLATADVLAQWSDYPADSCGWEPEVTHKITDP